MKKILSLALCVAILLCAFTSVFASQAKDNSTPIIKIGDKNDNDNPDNNDNGSWETDPIGFNNIADAEISGVVAKYYAGKAVTQTPTIKFGGQVLEAGKDYKLSYINHNAVGTATMVVKGIGAFSGKTEKKFLINLSKPKVKVTNGTYSIKLSWAKVPGAKQYGVYQYNTKTGEYKGIATTSSTSYLIKNKAAGTSYYFLVRAINGNNKSPCTTADNVKALTLCKAPGVKAAVSGKTVVLKITKPIGAKYFRVYKYNASTKKYTTLVSKTTATSVKLASQPKGTNYYLVRAFNANNAGSAFTTKNLTKAIVK